MQSKWHVLDELQDAYDPIDEEALLSLQEELGVTLPADYFRFLLVYNGGRFRHPLACPLKDTSNEDVSNASADWIFGIDTGEYWSDIRWNHETFLGRIPSNTLPFGSSSNHILYFSFNEAQSGQVFLWDHSEEQERPTEEIVYLVANSFTEFLEANTILPDRDRYDLTEELPIFQAVERGDLRTVLAFVQDTGEVDARNPDLLTLLMCAARSQWPRMVERLITKGADVDATDIKGRTALHFAVDFPSFDSAKSLLAGGADPNLRDTEGQSALARAKESDWERMEQLLMTHGAR